MPLFEIRHRYYSGAILFQLECSSLKLCVEAAVEAHADLAGADLAGAYLTDANLAGANLARADLAGADLTDANLAGAYLTDANLARANLARANLAGAYLTDANLAHANLDGADLAGNLKPATKDESIANLDKVREIVLDNEQRLAMGDWHSDDGWMERTCAEEAVCGTTHCLAGWLQVCATEPEIKKLPPHIAGYICAPVAAKMFYKRDHEALEWLRERQYVAELGK